MVMDFGFDGVYEATVKFAMTSRPRMRKAQMRIDQPKPTCLMRRPTMMGKMTPPKLDPVARMPYAAPRFLSNHPEIVFNAATWTFRAVANTCVVGFIFLPG